MRRKARKRSRPRNRGLFTPAVVVLAVAGLGLLLYVGGREREAEGAGGANGTAPAFTLASTSGGSVSLADYAGENVLLYFNEGVGCDACFYQMVELERHSDRFTKAGIEVVPIVANPMATVIPELQRFGLSTPYLIDRSTSVSQAYGMIGHGMHAGLPGHGFVLVDRQGEIRWTEEYPSMFVSAEDLLAALPSLS